MTKIHDAIIFAARKHAGQVRKGTDIPYISHPMEVMDILRENGCPEHVIIAGILHDTLEDTGATPEEIGGKFGGDILRIVQAESEDKSKTWKERKQTAIDHLGGLSLAEKQVCCADKLSNLRSMYSDLQDVGEALWSRFNAPKADIRWYYEGIRDALWGSLPDYPMFKELDKLIIPVFGDFGQDDPHKLLYDGEDPWKSMEGGIWDYRKFNGNLYMGIHWYSDNDGNGYYHGKDNAGQNYIINTKGDIVPTDKELDAMWGGAGPEEVIEEIAKRKAKK